MRNADGNAAIGMGMAWALSIPVSTSHLEYAVASSRSRTSSVQRGSAQRSSANNAVTRMCGARRHTSSRHTIKKLPDAVISHLASGQLLHSYTDILRELIENALDACATSIEASIDFHSRTLCVCDNGVGISAVSQAAVANCTSKLRYLSDLNQGVRTLGFRGRALWSISSVCKGGVEICSRTSACTIGECVCITNATTAAEGGGACTRSTWRKAMREGTVVTARNIDTAHITNGTSISTTPPNNCTSARKRTLSRTELREKVVDFVFAFPHVSFTLSETGMSSCSTRILFSHRPCFPSARMCAMFALARYAGPVLDAHAMRSVSTRVRDMGGVRVTVGSVSANGMLNKIKALTKTRVVIIVLNGRVIQAESLRNQLAKHSRAYQALMSLAMKNVRALVQIRVARSLINWNCAPDKSLVQWTCENAQRSVVQAVSNSLAKALRYNAPRFAHSSLFDEKNDGSHGVNGNGILYGDAFQNGVHALSSLLARTHLASPLSVRPHTSPLTNAGKALHNGDDNVGILGGARVIAQVLHTYVLVERSDGILLIEQHGAEERILYERLLSCWSDTFISLQKPLLLHSVDELGAFALISLGFDVRESEGQGEHDTWQLYNAPRVLADGNGDGDMLVERVCELAVLCSDHQDSAHGIVMRAAQNLACRMAVRNGTVLSMKRMTEIVRQLAKCDAPSVCAHGRPVLLEMNASTLARSFGRRYVPAVNKNSFSPLPATGLIDECIPELEPE